MTQETLTATDEILLQIYKFVLPIIGAAGIVILGFIASWIKKISKDMGEIKVSLVKHDGYHESHSKAIAELKNSNEEKTKKIQEIEIKIAKINLQ